MSVLFCCNADGSEKMAPWYIGTAKKPRIFAASGVNIENLNLRWRSNGTARMVGAIFEEWLRWFDSSMHNRKVALLLDNFSAHETAVRAINNSRTPLQNTLIIWLPPNSTSRFQPLDQGIIKTWKAYWKRRWLNFLLSGFEKGNNPVRSMNVLHALQWGIRAWDLDVSADTIKNCFQKGLSMSFDMGNNSLETDTRILIVDEISSGLQALQEWVPNLMDIVNFLNPADELIHDELATVDEVVLSAFLPEVDEDEFIVEQPRISHHEAIQALDTLRLYEEQQDAGDAQFISTLNRHKRVIIARKKALQEQSDIRSFFGA
jgi:hypothetical protein